MRWWKWVGLGALAAVAVAGAAVAVRSRRQWVDADDEEISRRLHGRLDELRAGTPAA